MLTGAVMNKYCVYLHRKQSDNSVFYVGKGSKKRSRSSLGRSAYWGRISNKHGFYPEIVDENISEQDAFELEIFLIQEIGRDNLCNMTDGGEGASGVKMSEKNRLNLMKINKGKRPSDKSILASIEHHSVKVGTTCGLSFNSMTEAALYLTELGFKKASKSSISACIRGITKQAYGYEWRKIVDGEIKPSAYKYKRAYKKIGTDCGLVFDSIKDVMEFIGKPNTNNYQSGVYNCIAGRSDTIYGYRWGYIEDGIFVKKPYELIGHGIKIKTECGLRFNSSVEAESYLRFNGFAKASQGNISNSLCKRTKSAYGFVWSYDNDI